MGTSTSCNSVNEDCERDKMGWLDLFDQFLPVSDLIGFSHI
jgi:hypothetical protein